MFAFVTQRILSPIVLRFGLASIFVFHGLLKVNGANDWGAQWHPQMSAILQLLISYSLLLGGIALFFGFLTRLAALELSGVTFGALLVGWENVTVAYNLLLMIMCFTVILMGPGPVSLDRLLFPPRKKKSVKQPQPPQPTQPYPQQKIKKVKHRSSQSARPQQGHRSK